MAPTQPLVNTPAPVPASMQGNKASLDDIFGSSASPASKPALDSILGIGSYAVEKKPTFGEDVATDLKKRGNAIVDETGQLQDSINRAQAPNATTLDTLHATIKPLETTLRNAGQVAGGVTDVISTAVSHLIPDEWKDKGKELLSTEVGQAGVHALASGLDTYKTWAEKHPDVSKDLEAVFNIAGATPVAEVPGAIAKVVRPVRDLTVGAVTKTAKGAKNLISPVDAIADISSSPEVHPFIASSPENAKIVADAVKQGYEPKDIKFLSTINNADRPATQEMLDLASKGEGDVRAEALGKRPMDVVGDTTLAPLREIQNINARAGAEVDSTARALSGTTVDATEVGNTARKALENAGVTFDSNTGVPNFDNSIFKKTKALSSKIQNAFSDLPEGEIDAYDLHKFKKSLDEIIDYEKKSSGGLTGQTERLLQGVRAKADEVLDSNFPEYNKANTDFKETRDLIDKAHEVFGKKVDFLSGNANMSVGQAMRSLFSNNKSRAGLYDFLGELQTTAEKHGVQMTQSPADQALFAQVLEKVYGTPAITGLQGQVGNALKTAIEFKTNPALATIKKGAELIDRLQNITPEEKKRVLEAFTRAEQKAPEAPKTPQDEVVPAKTGIRGMVDPFYALRDKQGKFSKEEALQKVEDLVVEKLPDEVRKDVADHAFNLENIQKVSPKIREIILEDTANFLSKLGLFKYEGKVIDADIPLMESILDKMAETSDSLTTKAEDMMKGR